MPSFKIAHVHEQGQDIIIVPLDSSFGHKDRDSQDEAISDLQMAATSAGLRGLVVPVWDSGGGRMSFIAPQPWHPFFRSISLHQVYQILNRTLSW